MPVSVVWSACEQIFCWSDLLSLEAHAAGRGPFELEAVVGDTFDVKDHIQHRTYIIQDKIN